MDERAAPPPASDGYDLIRHTLGTFRRTLPAWRAAVADAPSLLAVAEVERAFTRHILEGAACRC